MNVIILCLIAVFATACAPVQQEAPPEKTQLEVRECQTRTFETSDMRLVMKSMLNVLQDDGFMVKNVALDLGFLAATKEVGIRGSTRAVQVGFDDDFLDFDPFGLHGRRRSRFRIQRQSPPRPSHVVVDVTMNVTEFGDKVRVRASFQEKLVDTNSSVMKVQTIDDEIFYQDFFAKVDKGIFLQQQNI